LWHTTRTEIKHGSPLPLIGPIQQRKQLTQSAYDLWLVNERDGEKI
jgi:hypothetical protein